MLDWQLCQICYPLEIKLLLLLLLLLLQNENETEHIDDNLLADIRQNNDSADLNCIITDEEVRQSIAHLHANKSTGPDGLPADFFKCTMEFTVPYLTNVF